MAEARVRDKNGNLIKKGDHIEFIPPEPARHMVHGKVRAMSHRTGILTGQPSKIVIEVDADYEFGFEGAIGAVIPEIILGNVAVVKMPDKSAPENQS